MELAGELDESDSDDEEVNAGVPRKRLATFSVGTLGSETRAKAKAKAGGKKMSTPASAANSMSAPAHPGRSPREDSPSQSGHGSGAKKLSKVDRQVDDAIKALSHDEEMARVAKKHLGTQKGSSTKCLTYLGVKTILQGERPGNALTGVRVLERETLLTFFARPFNLIILINQFNH